MHAGEPLLLVKVESYGAAVEPRVAPKGFVIASSERVADVIKFVSNF